MAPPVQVAGTDVGLAWWLFVALGEVAAFLAGHELLLWAVVSQPAARLSLASLLFGSSRWQYISTVTTLCSWRFSRSASVLVRVGELAGKSAHIVDVPSMWPRVEASGL